MMATQTATRARSNARRTTAAKQSANAKSEARADNGQFKQTGGGALEGKGAMIGAAAAGLAVGLVANIARKFAVQSPTMLSGEWDQALANEHKLTLKVFDAIEATTEKNTTKRATLLMNLKHMLAKHALEEENTVYPAMRETGDVEAADHLNKDHGYVKQYLYELTDMPNDAPAWIEKVRQFRTEIEAHMREEETTLFPRLKAKLTPERNKELTVAMNKEGFKLA
jgi:hemerythrin superfamily protein